MISLSYKESPRDASAPVVISFHPITDDTVSRNYYRGSCTDSTVLLYEYSRFIIKIISFIYN